MKIFEWIKAKLNIRFVGGSLPCGHECTIVAMNISNKLEHKTVWQCPLTYRA